MILSPTADAIIERAKESYTLSLIDERRLERVTERALTEHGYSPILDLPLHFELEEARRLNREALRRRGFWFGFRGGLKWWLLS